MIPIPSTVYIAAAIAVAGFAGGYYISDVISDTAYAKLEANYANERAISAEASRKAEQAARETEQTWQIAVNQATEAANDATRTRDRSIAALSATNGKLQQRIAAITAASSTSCDTSTSCADLLQYIERAGPLVVELDGFAAEAAASADTLRDELALCRNYVKALQ